MIATRRQPDARTGRYCIWMPSGQKIPFTDRNENTLWERYCEIRNITRDELGAMGYRSAMLPDRLELREDDYCSRAREPMKCYLG
jgi:hypothetical protein